MADILPEASGGGLNSLGYNSGWGFPSPDFEIVNNADMFKLFKRRWRIDGGWFPLFDPLTAQHIGYYGNVSNGSNVRLRNAAGAEVAVHSSLGYYHDSVIFSPDNVLKVGGVNYLYGFKVHNPGNNNQYQDYYLARMNINNGVVETLGSRFNLPNEHMYKAVVMYKLPNGELTWQAAARETSGAVTRVFKSGRINLSGSVTGVTDTLGTDMAIPNLYATWGNTATALWGYVGVRPLIPGKLWPFQTNIHGKNAHGNRGPNSGSVARIIYKMDNARNRDENNFDALSVNMGPWPPSMDLREPVLIADYYYFYKNIGVSTSSQTNIERYFVTDAPGLIRVHKDKLIQWCIDNIRDYTGVIITP